MRLFGSPFEPPIAIVELHHANAVKSLAANRLIAIT